MSHADELACLVYGRLPTSDEVQGGLESPLAVAAVVELGKLRHENVELLATLARVARKTRDGVWVTPGDWVYVANSGVAMRLQVSRSFTVPMCVLGDDGVYHDLSVEECWRDRPEVKGGGSAA